MTPLPQGAPLPDDDTADCALEGTAALPAAYHASVDYPMSAMWCRETFRAAERLLVQVMRDGFDPQARTDAAHLLVALRDTDTFNRDTP